MEDLRDELLRDHAEAWRPEPGDVLIGLVVALDEHPGFAGVLYPIVTVRGEDGSELAFHAYHEVAKDELGRLKPKIGEQLGVAYLGRHPEKGYARYRIKVVRDEAIDWRAMHEDQREPERASAAEQVAAGADVDDLPF